MYKPGDIVGISPNSGSYDSNRVKDIVQRRDNAFKIIFVDYDLPYPIYLETEELEFIPFSEIELEPLFIIEGTLGIQPCKAKNT